MKTNLSRFLRKATLLAGVCFLTVNLDGCKKESVPAGPIDPKDANSLSGVIVLPAGTQNVSGTLPTTSAGTTTITNNPTVSLTSGGSQVFIPIQYSGSTAIGAVYVQIKGANTYFSVPVSGATSAGLIYVPISLPSNVLQGTFTITIVLVGTNGATVASQTVDVPVNITLPLACGNGSVSGSSGITATEHELNGKAGNVTMTYSTYSLPDRIDVYVDGKWVAGTGTSIAPPPPLSTCSNPSAGFVGASGKFTFPVTSSSQRVQTYVSGCTGSATAWDYSLTCP